MSFVTSLFKCFFLVMTYGISGLCLKQILNSAKLFTIGAIKGFCDCQIPFWPLARLLFHHGLQI